MPFQLQSMQGSRKREPSGFGNAAGNGMKQEHPQSIGRKQP
jgi:hypothetical protein